RAFLRRVVNQQQPTGGGRHEVRSTPQSFIKIHDGREPLFFLIIGLAAVKVGVGHVLWIENASSMLDRLIVVLNGAVKVLLEIMNFAAVVKNPRMRIDANSFGIISRRALEIAQGAI